MIESCGDKRTQMRRIVRERLELLRKKYGGEGSFGADEAARLATLTEKLNRICPRITPEMLEELRGMRRQIGIIDDLLDGDGSV